ncbi:MAG TPA: undecaprenyl-phosphate glucose phosphotransferase [Oligoflexia bacterium]|nr:undecaprenyl-phosphate glucose phosphotransferase [Oligoflexia bacterium]HMP47099.1 undecaprenyl-phosphate glucose phosphotransferase [Oligoflexia bacterium]
MLKRHAQLFEGLFVVVDIVVVTFAWLLSYWIRFSLGVLPLDKGVPPFRDYVPMLIFVWLIWIFLYRRMGLYRPMRGQSQLREIGLLIKANAFAVILLLAATYLFKEKTVPLSRLVFLTFWGLQTIFSIIARLGIRSFLRDMRKKGYNLRYALIVGAGPLAQHIAASMVANKEFGIELMGFLASSRSELKTVTDEPRNNMDSTVYGPMPAPVVGTYDDLSDILSRGGVDQVIVALPLRDNDRLQDIVGSIGDSVIDVKLVPDIHQFIQLGSEVEEFDGVPVVSLASTPLDGINRVLKRVVDLVLASICLVIFIPFMIIIAIMVKLTSPGPVFFTQERVGLDGRSFRIYKFRTMRADDLSDKPQFTRKGDPRVTTFGRFLRVWSLDELPQLYNVLLGHMSLVGPRPERPVFIDEFRKRVPRYMLRHKVQAGMTGWAQVHGWRGNTCIERRIEHDLFYIENWSIALDLKILFLTLFRGFWNRNAY